jgi:hypothetical protein
VTSKPTTLIEELTRAARGVAGLVIGDRKSPGYFDFSLRGLYGSFIAYLLILGLNAVAPILLGIPGSQGTVLRVTLSNVLLYGAQVAACALALRQLDRRESFVPYLVANNWASFFFVFIALLVGLTSGGVGITLLILGILVIVVEVNIARVVIGLTAMKVVFFLVAQLVGGGVGLLLITLIFPPTAAEIAALQ